MKPLSYPVRPLGINQGFGSNADYYAKFHDDFGNPMKGHDGIDFRAPHGTPVHAAHDGFATFSTDVHGGEGVTIMSIGETDIGGAPTYYKTLYWHLCDAQKEPQYASPIILASGPVRVKKGDLIGYADNTGAPFESSGDHLHFGFHPCDEKGHDIEPANGFRGNIDPTPYFDGNYADVSVVQAQVEAVAVVVSHMTPDASPVEVGLVEKVISFIKQELNLMS